MCKILTGNACIICRIWYNTAIEKHEEKALSVVALKRPPIKQDGLVNQFRNIVTSKEQ